jgi:glutathione peroxidase
MKSNKIFLLLAAVMGLSAFLSAKLAKARKGSDMDLPASIYDFTLTGIDGTPVSLSAFRGRKMLIVNTASKCGKTPQYAGLQQLHERFGDRLAVLGFPANNFFWQEPGSAGDIAAFCERNYGVTFQMFDKISVRGSNKHPLYRWLEQKTGSVPDWNFAKYLVSEDGARVTFFKSGVQPLDAQLVAAIE